MFKFKKFDKHYKGWRVGSDMTVDENEKIYRFMDIWKFLSLIEAKELFFSRQSSF